MTPKFILASKSPRRKELLMMLGMEFEVIVSDCDETVEDELPPHELVCELAMRKARAVAETHEFEGDYIVIGSDTVVWDGERILGKPRDREDAKNTFLSLSDRENSVFSGIALIGRINGHEHAVSDAVETRVLFGKVSERDAEFYANSGEPLDKAGSYAVQGIGGFFVDKLYGDYYNVVGLPIARLRTMLKEGFGLEACDYIGKRSYNNGCNTRS